MNRGKYGWVNDNERESWERIVEGVIEGLLNDPDMEDWDASDFDINPWLLDKCVEAHGWECYESFFEREDSWLFYSHPDYPNRQMCIYSDSMSFKLQLSIDYREG